jgi:ubiquitin carboxyl-terminal hydrolase 19
MIRFCPKCKQHREATKQLSLWRLPQILVIQLKRFAFKNILYREKIDKFVEFPVNNLDLSGFYCGPHELSAQYELFGIVNHYGGMFGGHYTSCAKSSFDGEPLGKQLSLINCLIHQF